MGKYALEAHTPRGTGTRAFNAAIDLPETVSNFAFNRSLGLDVKFRGKPRFVGRESIMFDEGRGIQGEGDIELSKKEGQQLLANGWYKQTGARDESFPDLKIGVGGRAGPKIPTFQELRDDIASFYEGFVGTEASGAVEDHIYRKLAAGQSFESVEDEIQASSEFRTRYPGIEHQPQLTGPEYDATVRPFDAHFLENRGRVMNADEKRALFAVKTPEEKQQWITASVRDEGTSSIMDVFKPKTQGRF